MKQISISSFNDVMNNKSKYLVQKTNGHTGVPDDSDGEQGEYNEKFIFFCIQYRVEVIGVSTEFGPYRAVSTFVCF